MTNHFTIWTKKR